MPFDFGLGELVVILLCVAILFGATRFAGFDGRPSDPATGSRWTRTDWILAITAVVSVSIAVVLPMVWRP